MLEDKVEKVIMSCTTQEQLETAYKYMLLAIRIQQISIRSSYNLKWRFDALIRQQENKIYQNNKRA